LTTKGRIRDFFYSIIKNKRWENQIFYIFALNLIYKLTNQFLSFMKNLFTRLLSLLLVAFVVSNVQAQGTQNGDFVVRLKSTGIGTADYVGTAGTETCGWGYAQFGAAVTEEFEGEMIWVHDVVGGDSLACDSIAEDLTGKIALIRRGVCEFGAKSLWAQKAGAKAVIVVNHYNTATQTGCTTVGMGAGAVGSQVTIPVIFFPRTVGESIDAEFAAGYKPRACFLLPRMYDAAAAYHYATPVTQIDTLGNMQVHFVNRSTNAQTDIIVKVDIKAPNGSVTSIPVNIASLDAGVDTAIVFPGYFPPALVGKFDITFTNNKYNESRDSLRRSFIQTDYTWATDNFVIDPQGVGPTNLQFQTNGFKHQVGGLCLTGDDPAGAKASFVSFGIANKDSVYVAGGDAGSNEILAIVYDADVNNDAIIDDFASFEDMDDNFQQVGFGTYVMGANEVNDSIVNVPIGDLLGNDFVEMKPNHPYYVSLKYDGLLAGHGRCVRFSNTIGEFYLNFPTTPVYVDQIYSGWAGATVIQRLHTQGFNPIIDNTKSPKLDPSKVALSPNPATDIVNMDFSLSAINKSVTVRLLDWTGNVVSTEIRRDFQNGRVSMNTASLPSGAYVVWVSSSEGSTFKKVVVCH
jgi:PA domain/Secretion system C-terminal sorting domain